MLAILSVHFMCEWLDLSNMNWEAELNLTLYAPVSTDCCSSTDMLCSACLIKRSQNFAIRRIYIANFAILKIATFWSYHLHLREKSRSFSFTKLHDFLVGSAHVWSQATVHAFMHAAHAVCMRAEDIDTRFKERAYLAVRKYPRSRDEKSRHFSVTIYTG